MRLAEPEACNTQALVRAYPCEQVVTFLRSEPLHVLIYSCVSNPWLRNLPVQAVCSPPHGLLPLYTDEQASDARSWGLRR